MGRRNVQWTATFCNTLLITCDEEDRCGLIAALLVMKYALEKSSEQLSFNACDCDENVQSLLVSEQDRNSVRDVLEKYHVKCFAQHLVYIKLRFGRTHNICGANQM